MERLRKTTKIPHSTYSVIGYSTILSVLTPCSLVRGYEHFGRIEFLNLQYIYFIPWKLRQHIPVFWLEPHPERWLSWQRSFVCFLRLSKKFRGSSSIRSRELPSKLSNHQSSRRSTQSSWDTDSAVKWPANVRGAVTQSTTVRSEFWVAISSWDHSYVPDQSSVLLKFRA
jgi:hypothetical protein